MSDKETVVITGGSGFIGAQVSKTFDQAVEKLKSTHHINVSGWQKVKYSSILVCNAAIRDELRLDLTKEEDFSGLLGRAIPGKVFADSFDILSNDKYSGQPVYARLIMEIQTTEYVGDIRDYPPKTRTVPTLGTFEGFGIFVPANPTASTRNPELTGMSRLIVKNTPDDSSFGIFGSTTSEPKCVLYDQNSGTHLQDGRPIQLLLNFVKLNEMFKISSVGILKGKIEGFEWDAKEDD